jgi:hypothetical protein
VVALLTLGGPFRTPAPFAAPSEVGPIHFENRRQRSGIDFVLDNGGTVDKHVIEAALGGVALLDFDGDGFLDIYFTNGAQIPVLAKNKKSFYNRLYRNNRDGTFKDVTEAAGVKGRGYDMGVATGDFDNDGWTDIFVAGVNENTLYGNNGNGTFTDVTKRAGLSGVRKDGTKPWSVAAAWLDVDNDGYLDLFVSNYLDWSVKTSKKCGLHGSRLTCSPNDYRGLPNLLYRNNRDGTFTDISLQSGIGKHVGKGMGVAVADYDSDGRLDIFVANDRQINFLFRNIDGRSFEEVGVEAGVALPETGLPVSSMGAEFRDLNNDGWPDLSITALAEETFPLFLNDGRGMFIDSTFNAGLATTTMAMSGWGVGAFDFDNDGYKDLFFANSYVSENISFYAPHLVYKLRNAIFKNSRGGIFKDVTLQAGQALTAASAHRGSAFGDLDNDGRIDVVVSAINDRPEILYNDTRSGNHWILLDIQGKRSNRDGIGTKIRLVGQSGLVQYNHVSTSVGYASASDRRVHFGLGQDNRIGEIELQWPDGKVQILKNVAANQILKIIEE